jgi:predicted Zn-dependent protease
LLSDVSDVANIRKEIIMKRLFTGSRTRKSTRSQRRSHLRVEALEGRDVPANHLLIDFSPDAVPTERWQPASFAAAFNLRYANGYAPAFLDFNRDGYVGSNDIVPGAQAIANRVAQVLQQFDVQVWYGDIQSNTNLGIQWFNWGQQSADQVFVMYTGGIRQNGNVNIIGEAFQPAVGYVNEYYAYTYATSIASYFMNYFSGATPQQYAEKVAQTIVHEFGHLIGLGHVYGNPAGDPNVMNYNSNPSNAYVPDAWYQYIQQYDNYRNEYYGWQNPAQELRASLRGEPNYANYFRGRYSNFEVPGRQLVTAEEIMGDEHDGHAHDGEGLLSDAFARHAPQVQSITYGDANGLVVFLSDTRLKGDANLREVVASVSTRVRSPEVLLTSPDAAPESAYGRIDSVLVDSVQPGRGDHLNLADMTSLDLPSLLGINLEKDEFLVVCG